MHFIYQCYHPCTALLQTTMVTEKNKNMSFSAPLLGPSLQTMEGMETRRWVFFFFYFFFFLLFFFFSRQGFSVQPWLSWNNSLCRPGWPRTQKSTCLCLPSTGIKGVRHHCPAHFLPLLIKVSTAIHVDPIMGIFFQNQLPS